ncbi:RsmD family RNA methyltransferase [Patescibacteria group bacterium]|nr:RsmD family RNA methyltransferase [Patescibacteria group bacterium]
MPQEFVEIVRKKAVKFAGDAPRNYDVIFLDPFYKDTSHKFLMQNLENILEEDGIIAFFHGNNLDIEKILENTNLKVVDNRKFGQSYLTLIKN